MKYAHYYKTTGQILGWYDDSIHSKIPIPNIKISDEVWQNAIDNNHNKINEDGSTELFDFRTEDEKSEQEIFFKKAEINRQLATITVTTSSGNVFDANLEARQNMSDAIIASANMKDLIDKGLLPTDTVWDRRTWRLADNSEPIITIDELKEAHTLAILEYARIKGIGS